MELPSSTGPSDYTDPSVYQEYSEQYRAPSPPPTNGHNRIPPTPPPPEHDVTYDETYGRQSQLLEDSKIHEIRPRWTASKIIRSILYLIAVPFSGFWLLAAFVEIDQSGALTTLGFIAWLAMIIGGIIVFVRTQRRVQRLNFSRFLYCLMTVTIFCLAALIVENTLVPHLTANALASFILAMILMLYFLVVAVLALW